MLNNLDDTISAISTAAGISAIGIVRMSGILSHKIAENIIKKKLEIKKIQYSKFYDDKNNIIDTGIILAFSKPYSFTGEDLVEFHAHGNDLILNKILKRTIQLGARFAETGEFSFRAYINKKIDLIQAESINILINAKNLDYTDIILNSLEGNLSKDIKNIINDLLVLRCEIEASIDFPDDVNINHKNIKKNIVHIYTKFVKIINKTKLDTCVSQILKILILGNTNVGKSSLFNLLANKDRAIVTNIPGTTRDFIQDKININNKCFEIIDTAGFNKDSQCKIEKTSILKSFEQIKIVDYIIFIFDVQFPEKDQEIFNIILNRLRKNIKVLVLKNKIDLFNMSEQIIQQAKYTEIFISLKKKKGLTLLFEELQNINLNNNITQYIINNRHYNLLMNTKKELKNFYFLTKNNSELVFLADSLKRIDIFLSDIIGENPTNKLISKIFSNFCIGK